MYFTDILALPHPGHLNLALTYIEKHGKPLALYSDKASVFRINNKNATGGDGDTQFGRAMHELNIQTICAETSAAKVRVERAHQTLSTPRCLTVICHFHAR